MNAGTLMEPVGPSIGEGNSTYFELLKGLAGCYREPTGGVESSRRIIHRAAWKIPIQLLPAILMRDAGCQIDAASSTEFNALEV